MSHGGADYQPMPPGAQTQRVRCPPFASREEGVWLRIENTGVLSVNSGAGTSLGPSAHFEPVSSTK